jgi:hypothetical protein
MAAAALSFSVPALTRAVSFCLFERLSVAPLLLDGGLELCGRILQNGGMRLR